MSLGVFARAALLAAGMGLVFVTGGSGLASAETTGVVVRARVTRLSPEQPASIAWRWGGEGLGGNPVRGNLTTETPPPPVVGDVGEDALLSTEYRELGEQLDEALGEPDTPDRVVVKGKDYNEVYLLPGVWSKENPITTFRGGRFLTFQGENLYITDLGLDMVYVIDSNTYNVLVMIKLVVLIVPFRKSANLALVLAASPTLPAWWWTPRAACWWRTARTTGCASSARGGSSWASRGCRRCGDPAGCSCSPTPTACLYST